MHKTCCNSWIRLWDQSNIQLSKKSQKHERQKIEKQGSTPAEETDNYRNQNPSQCSIGSLPGSFVISSLKVGGYLCRINNRHNTKRQTTAQRYEDRPNKMIRDILLIGCTVIGSCCNMLELPTATRTKFSIIRQFCTTLWTKHLYLSSRFTFWISVVVNTLSDII